MIEASRQRNVIPADVRRHGRLPAAAGNDSREDVDPLVRGRDRARATTSSSGTSGTAARARRSTRRCGRRCRTGWRPTSRAPGSLRSSARASPTPTGCARRSAPSRTGSSRRRRWSSEVAARLDPFGRRADPGRRPRARRARPAGCSDGGGGVSGRRGAGVLTIVPNEVAAELVCSLPARAGDPLQPPRHEHRRGRVGRSPERRRAARGARRPGRPGTRSRGAGVGGAGRVLGLERAQRTRASLVRGFLVVPAELLPHRREHLVREQALVA